MSRIVVIGAGLGGLAAAARLAAAGHQVIVFDSAPTVGGKLGTLGRDGFTFDTGPSLLTLPGELTRLFDDTGGHADLPLTAVDPACAYVFADGTEVSFPHDPAALPAALDDALGVGTGESWRRLHDRSRRLRSGVAMASSILVDCAARCRRDPASLDRACRAPDQATPASSCGPRASTNRHRLITHP